MNLWVIFISGLTVGGLTCLAVQGGLLASIIAAREGRRSLFPVVSFLVSKLVAYAALGFILGAFGGVIRINQTVQIIMQLVAGLYMVAIALNLLNVHPVFRYFVIQPPRFLARRLKDQSRSKELFAPAILGAMTIFIPCGTTLAMEALAISSANALNGALIMATFVLGTSPLFFGVGWLTGVLGDNFREKFLKVAAVTVIYLGLVSVNGALISLGSPIAFQLNNKSLSNEASISQNIEITISSRGYTPNYVRVKKGMPVTVKLVARDAYSCASDFRIPSLGVSRNLTANESYTFTFTPKDTGRIKFSCSMGMYTGAIEVI